MDVFINECSLHEQFSVQEEFENAFLKFFTVVNQLLSKNLEYQFYQREHLYQVYKVVKNKEFIASYNALRDKSLKIAFRNALFNKLNAKDWLEEQVHSSDDLFMCHDEIVTDTCMAELAERIDQNLVSGGLLVNFPASKFNKMKYVAVEKNEQRIVDLDCVDNVIALSDWIEEKFHVSTLVYDAHLNSPPSDSQTVLRDEIRFERTSLPRFKGRALYREKRTGHIWYVDSLHFGQAAHLEVFDANGNHIGEADLEGNIDSSRRDPKKRLNL